MEKRNIEENFAQDYMEGTKWGIADKGIFQDNDEESMIASNLGGPTPFSADSVNTLVRATGDLCSPRSTAPLPIASTTRGPGCLTPGRHIARKRSDCNTEAPIVDISSFKRRPISRPECESPPKRAQPSTSSTALQLQREIKQLKAQNEVLENKMKDQLHEIKKLRTENEQRKRDQYATVSLTYSVL
jgi:hypothetical protein